MQNTIQILKQTSDGLVFGTKQLFNILDSIGDKNIAIVSLMGKQRTGKSLLLNYLLRFLKFNESSYSVFRTNESVPLRLDLRVGDESQANGIWMCSKPFIVTAKDGSDVALFLMETRCETKASSQQNGIIFAISLLLSSTSIINIKNDLTEDLLQFVEYFARFAQSLIGESKTELFQRLVFLVRDWDNECAYRFGYHSDYTFDVNNYKKKMLNPNINHCDAEQKTKKSLLSLFGDISCYLMPHPGKNVTKPSFCGQIDFIDKDFAGKVEEFAQLIIGKLEPITIGGRIVSAISLRNYFTKWQKKFGIDKSETMSLCPVLVDDKHETMALCPVSDINDDEVEFIQAINYYETISCFAKIDGQLESYSQKPNNIVYVELPCPASYNGMCETNEQYWYCFQCKECLEYGFDGYFYCECGRAGVNSFEFKCNSKNHSSNYLKFKEIQLKLLLSNKEVNILILGETGVGKSTWINGFVNYLTYPSLAEAKNHPLLSLIASSFTMTDNNYQRREINCGHDTNEVFTKGQSATQDPKAYVFDNNTKLIRIIDTPGIGDTRGIDQDKKNFDAILRYLTNLDKLHGICILLKPNNARLTVMFRFCIKELLTHLHRDASRNIVFCFTNARSTFYRPGDTMSALESLLKENQEVEIKILKDTIYCMDNEPFRFLCALHHGIEFDEEERTNYSKSWDKSVSETKRMVDYICKLTPHAISNTLSLNDTRKIINSLSKPMADIAQNILNNISVVEDKKREIQNLNEEELQQKLYMEVIQLEPKQLGFPRTVCTDKKCVKYHNIEGTKQCTTEFITHCHVQCYLKAVIPETYPNPELKTCKAMAGTAYCTNCGCSWEKHMHITYEQTQVTIKVIDKAVEDLIKNKQTMKEGIELQIKNMEQYVNELNDEKNMITVISAKFGGFLRINSIVPYNDALGEYLDVLIRMEKDKVSAGGDRKSLDSLEQTKISYQEEGRILNESMTTAGKAEQLTPIDMIKLVNELYSLKHKGKELKQIMDVVSSSKSQMSKFQETNYRSNYKEKPTSHFARPVNYVKSFWNGRRY